MPLRILAPILSPMRPSLSLLAALAFAALVAPPALADVTAEVRSRAGQAFDAGVKHFERSEYEEAAKAFLLADELLPNSQALANAIAAARKANDDLLVARTAERAIARAPADPELGAAARDALAEAERRLSRLELRCEPMPCSLKIDGESADPGLRYLLAGTHSLSSDGASGAQAAERVTFAPGTRYRVVLYPASGGAPAKHASVSSGDRPAAAPSASAPSGAPKPPGPDDATPRRPLPPGVVYAGLGVSAVLLGVTIWSGLDTLSAAHALPSPSPKSQRDDVLGRETRSNFLFGATLLVGAATAVVGLGFVDWPGGKGGAAALLAPTPGGAVGAVSGRF